MNDLIDRQAAIKTAIEWYDTHFRDGESIAGLATGLKNLPAAQPKIIYCKYCKWYGKLDNMFYRKNTCTNPRVGMKVGEKDFCSYAKRKEHV